MKQTRRFNSGKELYESVISKSINNELFKKQLVENPKETINNYAKGEYYISDSKSVVIDDQSNDSFIFLNIPAKIEIDELELTDAELEYVAGGGGSWTWSLLSGTICFGYQLAKHMDECEE